jgi:hypothetical protein
VHLLSGAPDVPPQGAAAPVPPQRVDAGLSEFAALEATVARLENELNELKAVVAGIRADRGTRE